MASLGGSEYDMSRLYDTIQTCPAPIIFIGSGYIMSAAVWIMSGCDYRMLHENTEIMIHEGSGGMDEAATHVDQEIMLEANKKRNSKWWDILSQNSRMPKSFWEFVGKRDLYISAHEAVELGLADKVITHPDRSQYRDYRNNKLNKKMPKAKTSQLVAKMLNRVKQDKTKFDIK
jgi:ATP-dependent protease ClpP protease subunit